MGKDLPSRSAGDEGETALKLVERHDASYATGTELEER
jgi:hypothetical protein